jgi:hypothetical protein
MTKIDGTTQNFSLGELIATRQAALSIDDTDVAEALRYEPRVISMIKTGAMQLPANRIAALADVLQVSRFQLMERLLGRQLPELWQVIRELMPLGELTSTEISLLKHLRTICDGRQAAPIVFDGASVIALVTQS